MPDDLSGQDLMLSPLEAAIRSGSRGSKTRHEDRPGVSASSAGDRIQPDWPACEKPMTIALQGEEQPSGLCDLSVPGLHAIRSVRLREPMTVANLHGRAIVHGGHRHRGIGQRFIPVDGAGRLFLIIRHCSFSGLWCRGRSSRDAPDKLKSEFTLSMGVRCRFQGGTSIAFCPAETSPKTQRFVS
jgi:hypothetical protein